MGSITKGFVSRMFTPTPGNVLFFVHIYFYRTEFRTSMAAIAKRLSGRQATGTPGIIPFFAFHYKR